jgi:hypothetical protein
VITTDVADCLMNTPHLKLLAEALGLLSAWARAADGQRRDRRRAGALNRIKLEAGSQGRIWECGVQ